MITQEQRDLRDALVKHAERNNPELDTHTRSMIIALGSIIEGASVDRALGAPGDWGYGTPIGDALLAYLTR
jgi:hypothetical protein